MERHFSDRKQNKRKLTSANAEPRMLNDFRFREQDHPRVAATEDGQMHIYFCFMIHQFAYLFTVQCKLFLRNTSYIDLRI